MAATSSVSGVLLIDKPAGITSHDVVARIRRGPVARGGKVGHAGTLDPFATGLLVVLIGRATRFARYLVGLPKSYLAGARFGATSDSGDPTGEITETGRSVTEAELRSALPALTGPIEQRTPMTSAVKVGGERLYRKARRGEQIETPMRQVTIDRFELLRFDEPEQRADFAVDCSSGTYVRQLIEDLGERCGAGAYCDRLQRTAVGRLRLEDADNERLISLAEALDFLPQHDATPEQGDYVRHGRPIEANGVQDGALVRIVQADQLLAVAERRGDVLKPVTVVGG